MTRHVRDDIDRLAQKIFSLNLRDHEISSGREIVGILLKIEDSSLAPEALPLFGRCTPELLNAITRKGILHSVAGWRVDAGPLLGVEPSVDLLLVSDRLLNGPHSEYLAALVHEMCHFVVDTPISWLEPRDDAKRAAPQIRRHTQYALNGPYGDDQYHTDSWFSVLFEATHRLYLSAPDLFPSHEAATEATLCYDLVDAHFEEVPWRT